MLVAEISTLMNAPECLSNLGILAWSIGWQEIILIALVVLILFGGRKIPELARGIGRGMREFKREMRGVKEDLEKAMDEDEEEVSRPKPKKKHRPRPSEDQPEPTEKAEDTDEADTTA